MSFRGSSRLPRQWKANRLSSLLSRRQRDGRSHLDLTLSNPTAVGLAAPTGGGLELHGADEPYRPAPRGLPEAVAAVARQFGRGGDSPEADRIVLTASTSEAYSFLFKLLCDPGDDVVAPRPGYPLFEPLASLEQVRLGFYNLELADTWRLDRESLLAALTPRTRAIILVSPHNPTGWVLAADDHRWLRRVAAEGQLALIADEVFGDFMFPGEAGWEATAAGSKAVKDLALAGDGGLCFTLGGLSKGAGLPQMKVAWILVGGDPALRRAALERLEWIADAYLSVAAPQQLALAGWLQQADGFRRELRRRLRQNRLALTDVLRRCPASRLLPAAGGWSAVLRLPAVISDEEVALSLLESHDVLVQPGYFYDFPPGTFLVVSLLGEPDLFAEASHRLVRHLGEVVAG